MARDEYAGVFVYHGTRYARQIINSGFLKCAEMGDTHVSLTRSFDVATYWAGMDRDNDNGCGHILVFDRDRLEALYGLKEFVSGPGYEDEREEACLVDIKLDPGVLLGVVRLPD